MKLTPEKPPYYEATPSLVPTGAYRAILNQTGTNNPVATVITNTLGLTVEWTRITQGNYQGYQMGGQAGGGFKPNKTFILVTSGNNPFILLASQLSPEDTVSLAAYDLNGAVQDGLDTVYVEVVTYK